MTNNYLQFENTRNAAVAGDQCRFSSGTNCSQQTASTRAEQKRAHGALPCDMERVRCNAIIRFQHGRFTLQAPNTRCAKVTAGGLGCVLLLPPTPRAGVPRTRKYTNAVSSGARNSARYRLSSFSLDPTGVHFASNHDCRLDRPTRDRA
jgi:hypothetical protein